MKHARLLLIDVVDPSLTDDFRFPLHLASLATYIIRKRIVKRSDVKIICTDHDDVFKVIKEFNPTIIGVSVLTPFYIYAENLVRNIKKIWHGPVIIGGPHISGYKKISNSPFDIGVIGEGEETLAELIKILQKYGKFTEEILNQVNGIIFVYKHKDKITPYRHLLPVEEISTLDYSLLSLERKIHYEAVLYRGKARLIKTIDMYSARGCPYNCLFCAYQVIWGSDKRLRFFDIKQVVDQIEFFYKEYKINAVSMMDDTFIVTKQRLSLLIQELTKRDLLGKVIFDTCFIRANLVDDEFASLLYKLHATSIFLGIESGSPSILNFLKNGSLQVAQIKKCIRILKKYNLTVIGSFMLFPPFEKRTDAQKSLNLARWFTKQKNAHELTFGITIPYPGTKLWEIALKEHIFSSSDIDWTRFMVLSKNFNSPFFFSELTVKEQKKLWYLYTKMTSSIRSRLMKEKEFNYIKNLAIAHNFFLHKTHILKNNYQEFFSSFLCHPFGTIKEIKHTFYYICLYVYKTWRKILYKNI